jgi:hexosaminidase
MFDKHSDVTSKIIFGGTTAKCAGFAPFNDCGMEHTKIALEACRQYGIKEVHAYSWADDGAECSLFSVLPQLTVYSEACYNGDTTIKNLNKMLKAYSGIDYETFMLLDEPNKMYDDRQKFEFVNPSKYLFFNDPLLGIFDFHVESVSYNKYFKESAERLEQKTSIQGYGYIFDTLSKLCRVLELKCDLGIRIRNAYRNKDKSGLLQIIDNIDQIIYRINDFYEAFKRQWNTEYKPFGFEVFDLRIGGLNRRLISAKEKISLFIKDELVIIDELEQDVLSFDGRGKANLSILKYRDIPTPNVLF